MNIKLTVYSWSFRRKLLLLLLVIFLPAFGIVVASGINQRQQAIVKAQDDALLLVRSLGAQQEQIVFATKMMLSTLAGLPEVQNLDAPACKKIFAELLRQYPFYTVITASKPDGNSFASSTPFHPGVNLSDRKHFKEAISSLDFSAGEYEVGRISKKRSINYAFPVLNVQKRLVAILTTGFDLDEFGHFLSSVNLPEGYAVVFTDHQGVRLFRLPEHIATVTGNLVLKGYFDAISGTAGEGLFTWTAQDNINRIVAFKQLRLRENSPPYLYISVGFPKDQILHNANLNMLRNLTFLGLATMVALSLAWILGNLFFIRPINRLVVATQQLGRGEMNTRTGLPHTPDELGHLAQSFDGMASMLELRVREREKAEATLRDNEQFLADIFNAIQDGLSIIDPELNIIQINPAMEKFGYAGPIVGRKCYEVYHCSSIPCEVCPVQQTLRTGKASREIVTEHLANGSDRFMEIYAFPLQDRTSGQVRAVIEYVRDVTAGKRVEEERLQLSKLESLANLAGGIAHDFNNILTAILGNIGLAMLEGEIGDRVHTKLVHAEQACLRAKALAQQLLTFAKGGTPIAKIISIAKLLKETATLALSGSRSRCELSIPEDLWSVSADEGQINQAVSNLLINADQAMPEGGVIEIRAENILLTNEPDFPLAPGKYVKLSFADRGTGILPEYLDKVFDPYFSTKQRGSGLGLATAYSIIKNHSGIIKVESLIGVGTTFYIYLPAIETGAPVDDPKQYMAVKGQGRILAMDDEKMVLDVLGEMLTYLGYEVDFAVDGSQALEKFTQAKETGQPFAAVILDLTVPGAMGGKDAIKEILKLDSQVKAIVSSGYSDDPIMSDFENYGFSAVVAKPYKVVELSKILQEVITVGKS